MRAFTKSFLLYSKVKSGNTKLHQFIIAKNLALAKENQKKKQTKRNLWFHFYFFLRMSNIKNEKNDFQKHIKRKADKKIDEIALSLFDDSIFNGFNNNIFFQPVTDDIISIKSLSPQIPPIITRTCIINRAVMNFIENLDLCLPIKVLSNNSQVLAKDLSHLPIDRPVAPSNEKRAAQVSHYIRKNWVLELPDTHHKATVANLSDTICDTFFNKSKFRNNIIVSHVTNSLYQQYSKSFFLNSLSQVVSFSLQSLFDNNICNLCSSNIDVPAILNDNNDSNSLQSDHFIEEELNEINNENVNSENVNSEKININKMKDPLIGGDKMELNKNMEKDLKTESDSLYAFDEKQINRLLNDGIKAVSKEITMNNLINQDFISDKFEDQLDHALIRLGNDFATDPKQDLRMSFRFVDQLIDHALWDLTLHKVCENSIKQILNETSQKIDLALRDSFAVILGNSTSRHSHSVK